MRLIVVAPRRIDHNTQITSKFDDDLPVVRYIPSGGSAAHNIISHIIHIPYDINNYIILYFVTRLCSTYGVLTKHERNRLEFEHSIRIIMYVCVYDKVI